VPPVSAASCGSLSELLVPVAQGHMAHTGQARWPSVHAGNDPARSPRGFAFGFAFFLIFASRSDVSDCNVRCTPSQPQIGAVLRVSSGEYQQSHCAPIKRFNQQLIAQRSQLHLQTLTGHLLGERGDRRAIASDASLHAGLAEGEEAALDAVGSVRGVLQGVGALPLAACAVSSLELHSTHRVSKTGTCVRESYYPRPEGIAGGGGA